MYMNQYRINVHESIPLESGSAALKIKNYGWHIALVVKKQKQHFSVQRYFRMFCSGNKVSSRHTGVIADISSREK